MVREIVHLQVGQCGNQVGMAIWNKLFQEHGLNKSCVRPAEVDKDSTDKIGVYFNQLQSGSTEAKYCPRALVVDLEPGTGDNIRNGALGHCFHDDAMVHGANGAGNNWAKGHYTEGAEIVDEVLGALTKQVESCDCPQGFQICHSLGGGTGSGLGTLLLLKIRDAYPDRITTTYSVFPSPKVSDTVVEPYNAVLSSHQLLENADETFVIDNEALYNIANNVLKQNQPQFDKLNVLVADVVAGITSSLRFPGKLNGDLRKLGVNLVPFPRLHFFLVSYAPLGTEEFIKNTKMSVKEISNQAWSSRNFYSNIKLEEGKTLACSILFRGNTFATVDVDEVCKNRQNTEQSEGRFVNWIPNNIKSGVCNVPTSKDIPIAATLIGNTTALKGIYQRLATQFGAMYKRKAFLHWYKGEGMDEMEFQEADKNVRDLITEYQDKQDAEWQEEEASGAEDDDEDI